MDRFRLARRSRCLPASRTPTPWTVLRDEEATRRRSMPGTPTIELYRTETGRLPRQSRDRRAARCGWCCGRPRADPPYDAVRGHGGSGRRRGLDRSRHRSGRGGADAGADPRSGCGFRRRAPRRAAVLQAQARPRRSGGAGAARARTARTTNERSEGFPRSAGRAASATAKAGATTACAGATSAADASRAAGRVRRGRQDRRAGIRSRKLAVARIRSRRTPTSARFCAGVPAELDPCGASPRLDRRSRDPRFRRARRERLGLHRSRPRCRDSVRSKRPTSEARAAWSSRDRSASSTRREATRRRPVARTSAAMQRNRTENPQRNSTMRQSKTSRRPRPARANRQSARTSTAKLLQHADYRSTARQAQ